MRREGRWFAEFGCDIYNEQLAFSTWHVGFVEAKC